MKFIKFKDKKSFNKWAKENSEITDMVNSNKTYLNEPLEARIYGPIGILPSREKGVHNQIFVYPQSFLEEFDKRNIGYQLIPKERVSKYLDRDLSKEDKAFITNYFGISLK